MFGSERVSVRGRLAWAGAVAACALLAAAGAPARAGDAVVDAPIRIALRADVEVRGPQVLLGDVAVLETRDLPILERLVALSIGPAPRTGTPARLERAPLLRWIRVRTGIEPDRVTWSGPEATTVRLALAAVPGMDIASEARRTLVAAVQRSGLREELGQPEVPQDVIVPAGVVELSARPVPRAAVLSRHPTVWVDVRVDGRFVRTVPVGFQLTVYGPGYVATSAGSTGEALAPGSVEVREVPWSGTEILPVGPEALAAARLRAPVRAGATLTQALVESVPAVSRGGWATLHSGRGLIAVESRVQVLEDGRAGQAVRVKLPSAGVIVARVAGPDRVEVER